MYKKHIPNYEILSLKEKANKYALLIPVINEGEKIQKQLRKLKELNYPIDIIIADGGSTDNSLNEEFLTSVNVTTLLTKKDVGKLSSQMRMGFDYCLKQDYDAVLTVDGNGKDSMESILLFIEKLENGYDFIQGSRYVPGGKAVNTPKDRYYALKYIHAPLISLFARHKYTDTTNGYRAHSKKLLESEKLAIFRDCFEEYNLHYYMSVWSARFGFKIAEVPVTRSYPDDGTVPSKIGGFSGKWKILKQTFNACLGNYNV